MKKIFLTMSVFGVMLMLIPAISLITSKNFDKEEIKKTPSYGDIIPTIQENISSDGETVTTKNNQEETVVLKEKEPYKVLDITTDEVMTVSVRDYLIGAVAAEMPSSFQEEALKAQAVAAHTYAERRRLLGEQPDLKGAYFSNDSSKYQAFFTESQMKQYFGETFESRYERIAKCVDEVLEIIITYNNEPIIAAFHSMSSGKTESAANVWGGDITYLIPVESESDKTAPKYQQDYTFSIEELKKNFEEYSKDIKLNENPAKVEDWFEIVQKTASQTIVKIKVGEVELKGSDVRAILGLRSSAFDIFLSNNIFTITTYGYGHGVGMSQFGANSLALDGKTYDEILLHYYPGTKLEKV
ncbi:MAG: stage II sporulation protein D [Oscillospiraceae bacterium]|jgi:stage II sporulation protein D|nr:stage II sporulation protein D [Oscillospiraceae bacterium]